MTEDVHLPPGATWQYPFDFTTALTVTPDPGGDGWHCQPQRVFTAATPAWGIRQPGTQTPSGVIDLSEAAYAADSAGVAEAFVDLLRHEVVPPVPGFQIMRLAPPPEARWERPVELATSTQDNPTDSVVVGERVVVTWVRHIRDTPHAGPAILAHLDAVDFFDVPETHGILLWTAPSGCEVPVAWATKYLPNARDGWDWCVDLASRAMGLTSGPVDPWMRDFPARLGRLAARLHLALATPSAVFPTATQWATPELIKAWHAAARSALARATDIARHGEVDGVADVLLPRLDSLTESVDGLLNLFGASPLQPGKSPATPASQLPVLQHIHGDFHVGQVLRWPGGLAVVDFHPNPGVDVADVAVHQPLHPAARDLARLLRSIDHVARVADRNTDFTATAAADSWSEISRFELLQAYKIELAAAGRPELLDERLLAPFEAEQLAREIIYAHDHLPSWAYAPLGGLWQTYAAQANPSTRGRHAHGPGESSEDQWIDITSQHPHFETTAE